jgi:uncharacterized membrane protein
MIEENGKVFTGKLNPAVMAVWAALLAVSKLLPSIPIVGTGATFSISTILTPLAGILFGPVPGVIIASVGGFIGQMIAPHTAWMGIFTFLIGVFNAYAAGCVVSKKWYIPIGIILLGSVLWVLNPIGKEALMIPAVFYSSGILAALLSGFLGRKWLLMDKSILKFIAIIFASYTGFVCASAYANYVGGLLMMQWPASMWNALAFVSPFERLIFSTGAAIVGVPLLFGLPKIGLFVGPQKAADAEV